jgi:uncharacterized protein YaaQ
MKLIIAIARDEDSDAIISALIEREYRVTRIASTGGFLRRGMTTMMVGVDEEKVDDVITVFESSFSSVAGDGKRRTTIFVLNVEHFTQV